MTDESKPATPGAFMTADDILGCVDDYVKLLPFEQYGPQDLVNYRRNLGTIITAQIGRRDQEIARLRRLLEGVTDGDA